MATKKKHLDRVRLPRETRAAVLGVDPLKPGEQSVSIRVRGPADLLERIAKLTPTERGEALARGLNLPP